jgi:hypothetical protein
MRRRLVIGLLATALIAPAQALAGEDSTAPVGSVEVIHDDRSNGLIRLAVPATDDLSGVATVEVSGDGVTWASFAYAPQIDWSVFDPAAGGDPAMGDRTVRVRWTDGVGNTSQAATTTLYLSQHGALEYPEPPVTGELFTIRPIYRPGHVPGPNGDCSWELSWGNTAALRDSEFNWTWGSLFTSGEADRGFCGEWTFTLPAVPVPQFVVRFSSFPMSTENDIWEGLAKVHPAAGSDDRRIRQSNIPLVQVLPNQEQMIVGDPITYTAYPIGTTLKSTDTWIVYWPDFDPPPGYEIAYKRQYGGKTMTFTPPKTGNWLVTWNGPAERPFDLNATYDPKARRRDDTPPTTTAPRQRIGGGTPGTTVPVTLEWSGSDVGWGIERFRLERSIDGGAWTKVALSKPRAKTIVQDLVPGHSYRYRVRATDEAGNLGAWEIGPRFRPRLIGDASASIAYGSTWLGEIDATAIDGDLHTADVAGSKVAFEFTGRDLAWIAETGPGKGRATVYIDGDLVATVDLHAADDHARRIVFRKHWSTAEAHRFRIVAEGTVGQPTVTLDAFAVLR